MKIFPPILFLAAEYNASGGYTLYALRQNGDDAGAVDAAPIRNHAVAVIICGRGVISKPADSDTARRVETDTDTFLSTRSGDTVAFFRRDRMSALESDLAERGTVPVGMFCTTKAADLPTVTAICAERIRGSINARHLLSPTDTGSAVLQAIVQRTYRPFLGGLLLLLAANALISPRLNSETERLRGELAARERSESRRTADNESEQALVRALSSRPDTPYAVICDRIAASVPEAVRLLSVEVEPPAGRFEAGKPLRRRKNTATITGSAPSSSTVSEFMSGLSASGLFRSVNLISIEHERKAAMLSFRIDLEL